MRHLLGTVGLLIGCQPPDAVVVEQVDDDPSIAIIHPPADVGTVSVDPDGVLRMLVAVDIDNLEFIEPNSTDELVTGEGHWHFLINDVYIVSPEDLFFEYVSQPDEFVPGPLSISATLQDNLHRDLDEFDTFKAVVEFELVGPNGDTG